MTWDVLTMPAVNLDGTSLCEAVKPIAELRELEALDPWTFRANWLQNPAAKGSTLFEQEPARFKLSELDYDGLRIIIGCDPAASEKDAADFSVAAALGVRGHGGQLEAYMLDMVRGHFALPELCDRLIALQKRWPGSRLVVEGVGGFKSVKQLLTRLAPKLRVTEIVPQLDKRRRAQALAACWNAGRFKVPLDAKWADLVIEEAMGFTGVGRGKKDIVDAMAHGFNAIAATRPVARSPVILPFG